MAKLWQSIAGEPPVFATGDEEKVAPLTRGRARCVWRKWTPSGSFSVPAQVRDSVTMRVEKAMIRSGKPKKVGPLGF